MNMPEAMRSDKKVQGSVAPSFLAPSELAEHGFPERVVQTFLDTATEHDAAVASRCPGKPATQLIEDGHRLKSFYIHAQSCYWVPMSGCVCQLPPLNKKGPGNMDFNLTEHIHTIAKFNALVDSAAAKHSKMSRDEAAVEESIVKWPFLPLAITQKALDRLFVDGYLVEAYTEGYRKVSSAGGEIFSVSRNTAKDVLVEFVAVCPCISKSAGRETVRLSELLSGGTGSHTEGVFISPCHWDLGDPLIHRNRSCSRQYQRRRWVSPGYPQVSRHASLGLHLQCA